MELECVSYRVQNVLHISKNGRKFPYQCIDPAPGIGTLMHLPQVSNATHTTTQSLPPLWWMSFP